MINITYKENCCGCTACASICPNHCITMIEDQEGFLYPKVEESSCINCGLCENVCHELHPYDEQTPKEILAAKNKDENVRLVSSSGGVFHLLAEKIISEGGVVFGARFDENWQVLIDYAETIDGVQAFMGSKYVQARMGTAYVDAKKFLNAGKKVLFSGTPCQIAGLHHYLRKEYDNLLTVDIFCHGVPSPKVWGRYLDEVVHACRKAISDVKFRNKRVGWRRFNFTMSYSVSEKMVALYSNHNYNHFMRAFLSDMILRPSCHQCQAKQGRSHSDITIADFWGISATLPEMDDDRGTCLVLVNTGKGHEFIDWNRIVYKQTTLAKSILCNPAYCCSSSVHPRRSEFFLQLDKVQSIVCLINDYVRYPIMKRIKIMLVNVKSLLNINKMHNKAEKEMEDTIPVSKILNLSNISFRSKRCGWKSYCMEIKMKVR